MYTVCLRQAWMFPSARFNTRTAQNIIIHRNLTGTPGKAHRKATGGFGLTRLAPAKNFKSDYNLLDKV